MGKKKASIIVLMLVLLTIGMLSLVFNIQPAKSEWTGTVYIRADGSIDPPYAPIITHDNVTYTLTDNITSSADGIIVERSNIIIDGNGYTLQGGGSGDGFGLNNVSYVTVENINIKNFSVGIWLDSAFHVTISGNNITNNDGAAFLFYSSYCTLYANNITNNSGDYTIYLDNSRNNSIEQNILINNRANPIISLFDDSSFNIFANNFLTIDPSPKGIWVSGDYNVITGNTITNASETAILLYGGAGNQIHGNIIRNNVKAITIGSSSNNVIYHNNFLNNSQQVYDYSWRYPDSYSPSINVWDNGYPSGGNYWSDYNGTDLHSGQYQDEPGSDGVGDAPYVIDDYNRDRYPLMIPWPSEHDLVMSMSNPAYIRLNSSFSLHAILTNEGSNDEADVEMSLLINGTIVESTTIPILKASSSYTLSCFWTPSEVGTYNVTAYAYPVPGELSIRNNRRTTFITVQPSWAEHEVIWIADNYVSIQEAINVANLGDTVLVKAGTYHENVVVNKAVSLIGENLDTTIVCGIENAITVVASNVTVHNFTITTRGEWSTGIKLRSSNNDIYGNNIAGNGHGVYLNHSSCNVIYGNNVTNNKYGGVRLEYSSYTIISGNNITANNGTGISLQMSAHNSIIGNNIVENDGDGISLSSSYSGLGSINNTIHGNNITANSFAGIRLSDASNNTVFENNLTSNGRQGISLLYSSNNHIFHNNFINNSQQAYFHYSGYVNFWDNGYPSGGNYWSNYNGTDSYSGTHQNQTGSDGIGDTPYVINEDNRDNYPLMTPWPSGPGLQDLEVALKAPTRLSPGSSTLIEATVSNKGINNEQNVTFSLFVNNTIVNSTTISLLEAASSHTISYLWTPTVEGTYNITAYVQPVSGETYKENNQETKFVTVSTAPTPPEVQVGVKAGDWIKVEYTITGWPAGQPCPEWLKVEFLTVEGTNATVRVTMHMSDGTEQNATVPVIIGAGGGEAFGLSGFVIPANLTAGDSVYISGYGNITIEGETTRTYAGASRTVVYASFSQYGTQLTYYWDKQTGVMVEASTTSGSVTATAKATETNMWQPAPSGFPIEPIYIIAIAIIIIIIVAAVLLIRKRKT